MSDAPAMPSQAAVLVDDEGESVLVKVQVPSGTTTADVDITCGSDSLTVRLKGSAQPLMSVVQLYSTVEPERMSSAVHGDSLNVRLRKRDVSQRWPALEAIPEKLPEQQAAKPEGAGAALEERQRVRDLLQAAQSGELPAFQAAACHYGDADLSRVRDGNGRTALHFAAQLGKRDMCSFLLDDGRISANVQDDYGETPLALAAGAGLIDTVQLLLSHRADPNLRRSQKAGPLHRAASAGNVAVVQALLAAGADVEAGSETGTPLLWAAGSSSAPVVQALLERGASPSAVAEGNVSAVFMSAASGAEDVVKLLLEAGADANTVALGGATALHAASEAGHLNIVLALLQAGADPMAKDDTGARPIEAAAEAGAREIVETLLPLTDQPSAWQGDWSGVAIMDAAAPSPSAAASPASQDIEVPKLEHEDSAAAAEAKLEGDVAFRAGLFEAAVRAYSKALAACTSNAVIWANRSAANLSAGDANAAFSDARISRTIDPKYAKAWYREGSAAKQMQRWEEAAQAFFEAFRQDPENNTIAEAFQDAIAQGQKAHAAAQQAGS